MRSHTKSANNFGVEIFEQGLVKKFICKKFGAVQKFFMPKFLHIYAHAQ